MSTAPRPPANLPPEAEPPESEQPNSEQSDSEQPDAQPPDDELAFSVHAVRAAILFEGLLAVAAYFLGELVNRPPGERILWNAADALWGVVAALPPLALLIVLMRLPLAAIDSVREFCRDFLIPLFRAASWWHIVLICALAGLGEEMLFRGFVQLGLTDAIGGTQGIVVGLAVASITFGLAHAATRAYTIAATVIGLYLGAVLLITGNLLVPIVAHAVYDLGAFAYLFWMNGEDNAAAANEPRSTANDAARARDEEL